MATLDQQRAQAAFKDVSALADPGRAAAAKKYASIVHKLPALITSAGLCQALHFIQARGNPDQLLVLDHLASQLKRVDSGIANRQQLMEKVRTAELGTYLRLTQEAFTCAAWYRRMVQGVLKIEAGEDDGGEP
jgi:CRISPR-associated protein Cmr5